MTINDQTDQLLFELQAVLNRFVDEYDLNHATIIGCMEILKIDYLTSGDDDEIVFTADQDLIDEIDDEEEDEEALPFWWRVRMWVR